MTKAKRITIERTYQAPLEDVWDLWTTKEGIESWWGPEGFAVEVRKIDLRPGGVLEYVMIAVAPAQIEFMKNAGLPLANEQRMTYTEVVPHRRLEYRLMADFIPGVSPYEITTTVELDPGAGGVRMVLTFDAMHDELWTRRSVMGHESELDKLDRVLGK